MFVYHIPQHSGIITQQQANGITCFFEAILAKEMPKARHAADAMEPRFYMVLQWNRRL